MSDTEYEYFEVTNFDLDNEFNPNRRRRKLTKNQQIYGVWGDDSDKESNGLDNRRGREECGAGFAGIATSARGAKNYTAPVSFVTGGIQQSGKNKENKEDGEDAKNISGITDDEDSQRVQHPDSESIDTHDINLEVDSNSSSESNSASEETDTKLSKKQLQPTWTLTEHMKVGAWEQHTRGIGAKLLLQMGYEPGKGLGKDLQGISYPVEARIRKGRGAIGAYGPEISKNVSTVASADANSIPENKEFIMKLNKWKKSVNTDVRIDKSFKKYSYKTVEEVLEKSKSANFIFTDKISKKMANVPVIDMTGPEKRVLSGYHALSQSKIQDEELYDISMEIQKKTTTSCGFSLPELLHNLSLIVSICEQEIIDLDNFERLTIARYFALEMEKKQLEEIVRLENNHINTLEKALLLVKELTLFDSNLTLQRAEQIFYKLQKDYAAEYKEFSLGDLAASVIVPLLKKKLINWQPLENPTLFTDLIKKWRSILETHTSNQANSQKTVFDPYSSLIWAGVIPSFRACAAHWESKNHQSMAALLECWAPLLPTWVLDSVLEQLVLPRLCMGVRDWDPLTDTFPIHIWILPWNSILGHKMEEFIFPTIREKLGNALQAWMPQDRSARAMLMPWKSAFDVTEMEIFLMQHIIPKLQLVLNDLVINPMQQDLELWNQVWEWHEIIPTIQMARLLDKHFFPKWIQVLVLWLNQSPDYIEVSRWFTGWKSMLSEEMLRETNIKEHFRRALEIMHRATDRNTTLTLAPAVGLFANTTQIRIPTAPHTQSVLPLPSLMDLQLAPPAQLEFKELISRRCAERGILFAPIPGRRELGKQVYRMGKLFCYIDRNVCMVSDNSSKNWTPSPLSIVLESALSGFV